MPITKYTHAPGTYGRPLLQLAREIGVHLATIHRWRTSGVLDANGIRRRLLMTRVGGRWYVRDGDLAEFFAALGEGPGGSRPGEPAANSAARGKDLERVGRDLDIAGIN